MAKKPTYRELEQEAAKRSRVKGALRKSARRLSTLLDFVPYPIEVLTMDGRVPYVNAAFTQMFGWSLKELEGRFIPFIPQELEQETAEDFERLLRQKAL
jgi:PAS domain S-box-containing protein